MGRPVGALTPALTIAISTIGARIAQLADMDLPVMAQVTYLVLWQDAGDVPAAITTMLTRKDVILCRLDGQAGVAQSRTEAVLRTQTPFVLFADDDQGFSPSGWTSLLTLFGERADLDFLCLRLRTQDGAWRKPYGGERERRVRFLNCLKVGTPELALRVASVRAAGLTFDRNFGAGARYPIGDEAVFICDALRASLRGLHASIDVGVHPVASSGTSFDKASTTARIAVMSRCFGRLAPLARIAFALKNYHRFSGITAAINFAIGPVRPD